MQLTLSPKNKSLINKNTQKIKLPNTSFRILTKQNLQSQLWDIYLIDPKHNFKDLIKKNIPNHIIKIFLKLITIIH